MRHITLGRRIGLCLSALAATMGACWAAAQMPPPAAAVAAAAPAAPAAHAEVTASDQEIATFFDRYMAKKIRELEIPGGALVIVRDGKPIFAKGYGYSDLATKRPVDLERSLFRAASISKLLPWILAMQLVEEGRLDLDKDLNTYLDFQIPMAFGQPITMRHLMTHTAGFPERFHGLFDPDLSTPLGQKLRENIPERVYAPGTTIAYSNYGAGLAGYVVERLRGQPWERVVAERIFDPVGMRHSTVAQPVPPRMQPFLVSNYEPLSTVPGEFRTTPVAPMGSLTASAADMGRLLATIANGGQGEKGRILSARGIQAMLTIQKPLGPGLSDGAGLGFLVGEHRGVPHAGHAGNMTSMATDMTLLPEQRLGWYYVLNSPGADEGARKIRAELLTAAIERFFAPEPPVIKATGSSSAKEVAGSYVSSRRIHSGPLMFSGLMNTTEAFANKDGSLTIESSGAISKWLPAGRDRFVEKRSGVPLAVTRGADGKVEQIASVQLYPVAVFERAPLLASLVPVLAAFAFGTIFLALLTRPILWAVRRQLQRKAAASGAPAEPSAARSPRDAQIRLWAGRSFWLIVATMAGWGLFGLAIAIDFAILFSVPSIIRVLLGLMTMMSVVFAGIIAADACLAWRDPERGWASRLGGCVLAAAALSGAFLFYALDIINFSANW